MRVAHRQHSTPFEWDRLPSNPKEKPVTTVQTLCLRGRTVPSISIFPSTRRDSAPDEVEITIHGDTVRNRCERLEKRQEGGEGQRWLVREQRFGSFERLVRLSSATKADAAKAEFNDGVLTITLPKSEEAKERRIPISGGQHATQKQDVQIEAGAD